MIPYDDAKNAVFQSVRVTDTETVPFLNSRGRILAEDVYADSDVPPFHKVAMDGFACRNDDVEKILEVVDVISAGGSPQRTISPGQCVRIMTGSVVPPECETVIPFEDSEIIQERHVRFLRAKKSANICYQGEDVHKGDRVMYAGMRIDARHISILAMSGKMNVQVFKRPRIGIAVTGNELVEPGAILQGPSHIRNSNGYAILSMLDPLGVQMDYAGIIPDKEDAIENTILDLFAKNDVLIMSGAVSMGDFDFIPDVLEKKGRNYFPWYPC